MDSDLDAARQVIAVASAPGRPGPQSLAPNLAVRAGMKARQMNRKVCLFDTTTDSALEKHAGLAVPSITDLPSGPLETEDLEALLVHHSGWNLNLLRGPITAAESWDRDDQVTLNREVLTALRKRFDYVFVATSILDLYSGPGRDLLAQSDQLCLEVTDNMATVLNTAMWLGTRDMSRGPHPGEPRVGFVFCPSGDSHLTVTEARAELDGVRHLGSMPKPNDARGVDPTALAAAGPDPVMAAALDAVLYEITRDLAFKPRRNEWWRRY